MKFFALRYAWDTLGYYFFSLHEGADNLFTSISNLCNVAFYEMKLRLTVIRSCMTQEWEHCYTLIVQSSYTTALSSTRGPWALTIYLTVVHRYTVKYDNWKYPVLHKAAETDPKITLGTTGLKVPHLCVISVSEFQIHVSLHFAWPFSSYRPFRQIYVLCNLLHQNIPISIISFNYIYSLLDAEESNRGLGHHDSTCLWPQYPTTATKWNWY